MTRDPVDVVLEQLFCAALAARNAYDAAIVAYDITRDESTDTRHADREASSATEYTVRAAYRAVAGITDPQARLTALLSCSVAQVRIATQMALEPAPPAPKRKRSR